MSTQNTASHISLWTDLTRRAPDEVRAAPASMLGFASWLRGDGARAWCALDEVPADRPYSMAAIVASALQNAPSPWSPLGAGSSLNPSSGRTPGPTVGDTRYAEVFRESTRALDKTKSAPYDQVRNPDWKSGKGGVMVVSMTRRGFLSATAGVAAASWLAGCGSGGASSGGGKSVTWAAHAANATPDLLDPFTKATGIKVNVRAIKSSDEARALLVNGGSGIDVVHDFVGAVGDTYAAGVLAPVDESKLSNLKNLLPQFKDETSGVVFDGKRYGAFMDWGTDSMFYVHDGGVGRELTSVSAMFDGQQAGKIAMPAVNFESLLIAGLHLGVSDVFQMNDADLDRAVDLLLEQKPDVRSYWQDIGELKNQFATGEVVLSFGWAPVLAVKEEAGIDIRWTVPREGQLLFYNINVMTQEAVDNDNAENAQALMNWLMGEEYQAALATKLQYRPTNAKAVDALDESTRVKLRLDDESFLQNANVWKQMDTQRYQAAWEQVVNA